MYEILKKNKTKLTEVDFCEFQVSLNNIANSGLSELHSETLSQKVVIGPLHMHTHSPKPPYSTTTIGNNFKAKAKDAVGGAEEEVPGVAAEGGCPMP